MQAKRTDLKKKKKEKKKEKQDGEANSGWRTSAIPHSKLSSSLSTTANHRTITEKAESITRVPSSSFAYIQVAKLSSHSVSILYKY